MERGTVCLQDAPPLPRPPAARSVVAWLGAAGWPIVSYLCSRLVLLLLAGLATAVEPAALILVPVCAAVAVHQIRTAGWPDRSARRSLLAPLLAPSGLGLLAGYLWYAVRQL